MRLLNRIKSTRRDIGYQKSLNPRTLPDAKRRKKRKKKKATGLIAFEQEKDEKKSHNPTPLSSAYEVF